jgi:hypothetical protein
MEGWPEEKRARCGCGWEARGGLRARAGARSWPVRSEIGRKRAIPIGGARDARARGKSNHHGAREGTPANLFGPFFLANGFWFLHYQKGTLVSDYHEATLHYRSNVYECAYHPDSFQALAMFDSVYKS